MRPPGPGETINPVRTLRAMAVYLDNPGDPASPAVGWRLESAEGGSYRMSFDGKRWRIRPLPDHDPDVVIRTSLEGWARFIASPRSERHLDELELSGETSRVEELLATFIVSADCVPA